MPRIESRAAGWEAIMLPLCYAAPSFCFLCSLTWHYLADSFACPKLYRLAFLIENRYNWIYWVIVLAQPYSFTSQLAIGMFQSPASAALTVHRKRLQGKLCRKVFHRFRPTLTSCRWKIIFNETLLHSNPGNCIGRLIMPSTHPMQPSKRDQTDLFSEDSFATSVRWLFWSVMKDALLCKWQTY